MTVESIFRVLNSTDNLMIIKGDKVLWVGQAYDIPFRFMECDVKNAKVLKLYLE